MGLAAVVAATMLQAVDNANKVFPEMATMPIPLVILLVCAIGAVIGLINGIVIAYLNVTPFITTHGYDDHRLRYQLPVLRLCRRVAYFRFRQPLLAVCPWAFVALGSFRLSYITFYALIAIFFVWILWNKNPFR